MKPDESFVRSVCQDLNIRLELVPFNGDEIGLTFMAPPGHLMGCNAKPGVEVFRRTHHGVWAVGRTIVLAGIVQKEKEE